MTAAHDPLAGLMALSEKILGRALSAEERSVLAQWAQHNMTTAQTTEAAVAAGAATLKQVADQYAAMLLQARDTIRQGQEATQQAVHNALASINPSVAMATAPAAAADGPPAGAATMPGGAAAADDPNHGKADDSELTASLATAFGPVIDRVVQARLDPVTLTIEARSTALEAKLDAMATAIAHLASTVPSPATDTVHAADTPAAGAGAHPATDAVHPADTPTAGAGAHPATGPGPSVKD